MGSQDTLSKLQSLRCRLMKLQITTLFLWVPNQTRISNFNLKAEIVWDLQALRLELL